MVEDLEAFLPHAQAEEAFNMLDDNGDGRLRLHDIRDAVIKIYKERRNLAMSLKVSPKSCMNLVWATTLSGSPGSVTAPCSSTTRCNSCQVLQVAAQGKLAVWSTVGTAP